MSEPREFWITENDFTGGYGQTPFSCKNRDPQGAWETIHVIEKSAYDQLAEKYAKAVEGLKYCADGCGKGYVNEDLLKELGEL